MSDFYWHLRWGLEHQGREIVVAAAVMTVVFALLKAIVLGALAQLPLGRAFVRALVAGAVSYLPAVAAATLLGYALGFEKVDDAIIHVAIVAAAWVVCVGIEATLWRPLPRGTAAALTGNTLSLGGLLAVWAFVHHGL